MSNDQLLTANSQVPQGYKQTEVGLIPEDWEVSKISDQFFIQLGKMLDVEKKKLVL
jgi:type I restriction enzyme, S subunit